MSVELFRSADTERMAHARAIRIAVFVDEQGCPLEEEFDAHDLAADADAVHALVRDAEGTLLATGRYYRTEPHTAQIGRMAVLSAARGRGIGRMLLDALMHDARERGYTAAALNAQQHAIPFYEKAGFAAHGDPFDEIGIPHQPMQRTL